MDISTKPDADKTCAELEAKSSELNKLQRELQIVERNLSRANTDEQFRAISAEFDRLKKQESNLKSEIAAIPTTAHPPQDSESEIAAAMKLLDHLSDLGQTTDFAAAREIFDLVDAKLFLRFHAEAMGKRTIFKIASGLLTFGSTHPPIAIYEGKTGRVAVQATIKKVDEVPRACGGSGLSADEKVNSLGNVSRGDRS